jgi:Tfp pilus assembly major pilin PilA
MDKHYTEVLKAAQASGEAHDYRHLEGWRDARKTTVRDLYHQGKISVALALRAGARPTDHIRALESGHVTVQQLLDAGVDLHKLEIVRNRMMGQVTSKAAKVAAAIEAAKPKVAMVIKRKDGAAKVVMSGTVERKPTAQEVAVAVALANVKAREKERKDREAKAKHGFEVKLSAQEQAALLARLQSKGQPVVK